MKKRGYSFKAEIVPKDKSTLQKKVFKKKLLLSIFERSFFCFGYSFKSEIVPKDKVNDFFAKK